MNVRRHHDMGGLVARDCMIGAAVPSYGAD